MASRKIAVRIIAAILALIILGGVIAVAFNVFATAAFTGESAPVLTVNALGDTFNIIVIVVFFVALAVLIALGIVYIINKRKR